MELERGILDEFWYAIHLEKGTVYEINISNLQKYRIDDSIDKKSISFVHIVYIRYSNNNSIQNMI